MALEQILILAPAKINLFLKIIRRRSDGYHELASPMQKIDLYDRLHLSKQYVRLVAKFRTPEHEKRRQNVRNLSCSGVEPEMAAKLPQTNQASGGQAALFLEAYARPGRTRTRCPA